MVLNRDDFLAQLLDTFQGEAQEHLSAITAGLLRLEQSKITLDEYQQTVEQIFRETHSLKGAARAVGLQEIEDLCQHQENIFSAIRKGSLNLSPDSFDLFHSIIKTLERLLAHEKGIKTADLISRLRLLQSGHDQETQKQDQKVLRDPLSQVPIPIPSIQHIPPVQNLLPNCSEKQKEENNNSGENTDLNTVQPESLDSSPFSLSEQVLYSIDQQPSSKGKGTIRISSDRLENLFARADDLMSARLAAGQRSMSLRELSQNFRNWRWTWSQISHDIEHLRTVAGQNRNGSFFLPPGEVERIVEFISYNRTFLQDLEGTITRISEAAMRDQYLLDTATTELIDEIKQVILVPASSILEFYPRAARDLARESGKDVDVLISGAEIEIDRRILDELRDPIMHLIRNCIDHGIETPEIRKIKGKPARGQIRISVIHVRGHQAEIRIFDDGAGIDFQAVKSAAIEKGVITTEDINRMEQYQVFRLIFKSGLSTKNQVTNISGRGLGLAIVLEKVEQIGGTIRVDSSPKGTEFILTLPLSLATFRGIRISVSGHNFFIPLRSVERVMQVHKEEIKTIENRTVVEIRNEPIAVIRLMQILGISEEITEKTEVHKIVIISASGLRFGLLVDQILGSQEIVVKDLGSQLRRVKHISGATILGDGTVIPVINCEDLAVTITGLEENPAFSPSIDFHNTKQSILVVEDSITSRMLLKNILEGAGYLVETAVDGKDALMKLKLKRADIIVSDVDMPRMDGFILTEKIRSDPALSEIPVILVTSLDSREDREHGITVGANAYIVKSSFDQSNLLEVIGRYISHG